jgi:hypothetical protein
VNEFHKIKGVYIVKEITKECENEWFTQNLERFGINSTRG